MAAQPVHKTDLARGHTKSPGGPRRHGLTGAPTGAMPRINQAIDTLPYTGLCRQATTRTGAGVGQPGGNQSIQRRLVHRVTFRLPENRSIPHKAIGVQRRDLGFGHTGQRTRSVHVLNAQQPLPAVRLRLQITAHGSHQRTEMQRPGRRRCKTAGACFLFSNGRGITHRIQPVASYSANNIRILCRRCHSTTPRFFS